MSIIIENNFSVFDKKFIIEKLESEVTIETINQVRNSLQLDKILNREEYFKKLFLQLNSDYSNKYLSKLSKFKYMSYLKEKITESFPYFETNYFSTIYVRRNLFLNSFKTLNYSNEKTIKPQYSDSSVTGRVSIKNGTNFLTMKKENRKNLYYKNGYETFEIDFKSCEPSFFTSITNKKKIDDVYSFFIEMFDLKIKRDKFKTSFLALIYGASESAVRKISGLKATQIKQIKDYLQVDTLKNNLNSQFEDKNYFLNYYGRPILSNNNTINYFVQSSVVDFAILSFADFCNHYSQIIPHAFIHDALIFSCHKNDTSILENIKYLKCPVKNIQIAVKINKIST